MTDPVVACTLGSDELESQGRRWSELRRRAELGQTRTSRGKRIRFRADPGVAEELERLVAVERECCSWATWTIEQSEDEVVLETTATGEGIAALHGMFRPAER